MPYCASTPADSRLLVVPLPNDVVGLVNSVPVCAAEPKIWQRIESSLLFMSVV